MDWPISENQAEVLESNYHQLSELLEVTKELAIKMFSKHVINVQQRDFFSTQENSFKASRDFLDMLSQSSQKCHFQTVQCLRELNAGYIANILENVTGKFYA